MPNKNLAVKLVIGAVDKASRTFARVTAKVAALGTAILTYFSGRGIADFFSSAVSGAADFEQQMDAVGAVTRATGEEMEAFEAKALAAGESTKFTALEAAQAMEELARAGQEPQEVIASLDSVLALAQANAIGLAESAQITAQALAGFNLQASESGRVADVLTLAAQSAKTTVTQLGEGLAYAAPLANAFGYTIEETTGFLAKMADAGLEASRGGTALENILRDLAAPAGKASKALDELGIESRDLADVLEELEKAGPRAEDALRAFSVEGGRGLRVLLAGGSEAARELIGSLEDVDDASGKAAKTMSDNLTGAFTALGSAWDTLKVRLATPLLEPLANEIRSVTEKIREFSASEAFILLRDRIKTTFDDITKSVKAFAEQFDFKQALADLSIFVSKAGGSFDYLKDKLLSVSKVFTIVFNTISATFNGLATLFRLIVADVTASIAFFSEAAASFAENLNSIGLASDETAGKVRKFATDMREYSRTSLTKARENADAVASAFRNIGEALEESGEEVDKSTENIKDLGDATEKVGLSLNEFEAQSELAAAAATAFATSTEKSTDATKELSSAVEESAQKIDFSRIKIGEQGEVLFDHTSIVGSSKKAIEEQSGAVGGNTDAVQENTDAVQENADVLGDVKTKIDDVKASAAEMGEAIRQSAETANASLTTLFDTLNAISEGTEIVRNGFDGLGDSATGAFSLIADSGESAGGAGGAGGSGGGSGGGSRTAGSDIDIQGLAEQLAADSRNLTGIKDYLFSWIETVGAFNAGGLDWVGDQLNQIRSLANEIREEQNIGRSQLPSVILQVNLDGETIARNTMEYSEIIGERSN